MPNTLHALQRQHSSASLTPDIEPFGEEFWAEWFRQPAYDVAEALIRLRRLRGLTQTELAELVGTKQPAIARLETGRANVSVERLVALAEALGASVTVRLEPMESLLSHARETPWWDRTVSAFLVPRDSDTLEAHGTFQVASTVGESETSHSHLRRFWSMSMPESADSVIYLHASPPGDTLDDIRHRDVVARDGA